MGHRQEREIHAACPTGRQAGRNPEKVGIDERRRREGQKGCVWWVVAGVQHRNDSHQLAKAAKTIIAQSE